MKVLVTGAQGQVGSELVKYGEHLGLNMITCGHKQLEISHPVEVDAYVRNVKPDIIINAAAYTDVDRAEQARIIAYGANRDGPLHLALACKKLKIPLLHLSTDYVFDGSNRKPYRENDQASPQGVYGKSKRDGERAIELHMTQYIILRVAWVFGSSGNNFMHTMLRLAAERDELVIVADQFGGPTWSVDIAKVLLNIVNRYVNNQDIKWGIYHYTGQPVTSRYGFACTIINTAKAMGKIEKAPKIKSVTMAEYQTLAQRPKNSVLDCHKLNKYFGIEQPDWRKGLMHALNSLE
jgi:dTDP-4-dehydrorhamnose reductase